MKFEHVVQVPAPADRVFPLLLDVPRIARCVPGVEAVEARDGGRYGGRLRVQVGPIRLALSGEVTIVSRDAAARVATMRADADDRATGGVRALMTIAVADAAAGSELRITSDVQVLGRLGELGQPIMKRKADQLIAEFGRCLAREAT